MSIFESDNEGKNPLTGLPDENNTQDVNKIPDADTEEPAQAPEEDSSPVENPAQEPATPVEEPSPMNQPQEPFYSRPYVAPEAPQGTQPPKKKKGLAYGGVVLLVVLCLAISIFSGSLINRFLGGDPSLSTTTTVPMPETTASTPGTTTPGTPIAETTSARTETAPVAETNVSTTPISLYATLAEKCMPSVVVIQVSTSTVSDGEEFVATGAGSGVIYREDGYIITNYHVVGADTKAISVMLYNGEVYAGTYIYGDEYTDISVIKIDKKDCVPAQIGDSTKVKCGDIVVAIGNPLGSGLTITEGIISALARDITIDNLTMTLMQTTAAINHGNSGGGLFNANGELIGIVNAKSEGAAIDSVGFAIPTATVIKCVNDLSNYGYVTGKARLGVTVQTKSYQMWPYLQTYQLIQVMEVNPNGSAATSGLKAGDILQKINGEEISSYAVLQKILTKYAVGDTITLTVRRPTIEYTGNNLSDYLNTCEEVVLTIRFVEFNPNA